MSSLARPGYAYEDDLAVESAAYLDRALPADAVWWHTPNQGRGDGRTKTDAVGAMMMAAKLKSMGMKAGVPDVFVVWNGRLHATDAKSETGTLSASQREMFARLEAAGVLVKPTYRTIEELESHLTEWGIPLLFRYAELRTKTVMKPSEAMAMTAIATASATVRKRRAKRQGGQRHGARSSGSPVI